uniref:Acetylglutamate kinase n=1 Tax=Symphyocladiella dendroidea TaxID=2506487 RepID=A0A1Z1M7J2_9FLOR|nr:acetylglutamate kinase [Symphyocladiella dendroidea]ARW61949.1 acetylglutamate kinase [Symphyocladiella dendroidea]
MSNSVTSERFYFSVDTLSLIRKYAGSTFVIKYGGSAMKSKSLQLNVIYDIAFLYSLGIKIILVHGGGYLIDSWLVRLNIKPKFERGLRVTDANTMQVVEMVLSGYINKNLISLLNQYDIPALGLSGKDAKLVTAFPLSQNFNDFTGKVDNINDKMLSTLLDNSFLPVIASVASDVKGDTYNINADTLASAIASNIKADKLILLTDTPGVLYNIHDSSSLIKHINLNEIYNLKSTGVITDGMIPKIDCCIHALNNNVPAVHVIDGRVRYALLYELLTNNRLGSMLVL